MKHIFINKIFLNKTFFKKLFPLCLTGSILFLSGCNTYHNDFDCPMSEGLRCAPLSYVNKAIDQGNIDLDAYERALDASKTEDMLTNGVKIDPIILWVLPDSNRTYANQPVEIY